VQQLLTDCRHALRLYVRTPGASVLAVFVLAIGMAFVVAFLSLYVDLILRPHPGFEQSRRIATIGQNVGTDLSGITYEAVARIAEEMTSIEAAAMFTSSSVLVGPDREQTTASMVSAEFFSGLRPRLQLGRGFDLEEHARDAEPAVVLSYRYWRERFASDPNVVGSYLLIGRPASRAQAELRGDRPREEQNEDEEQEAAQFRIIGVMADSLPNIVPWSAGSSFDPAIWLPLERAWPLLGRAEQELPRLMTSGTLVRRMPGVPASAVASELRARYGSEQRLWNGRPGAELDAIEGVVGNSVTHKEAKRQLELFLAASVLLALVAAANVSLFLLARAPGRSRELGIRMAVGAPLKRIARQLATEAGVLVVVATLLGLVGSVWLSVYLRNLAFLRQAEWRHVTLLDWRVLSLAGGVLLLLTLFVSLAPILGVKRLGIATASRRVAARASPAQRLAGTTQIAMAGMFGGAAIGFAWYLGAVLFGNVGYATANRYLAQTFVESPAAEVSANLEAGRWREAVEAIPGVKAVAFGNPVPGAEGTRTPTQIPDPVDPANEIEVYTGTLERRFIELLDLKLIQGRAPEDGEANVVLVNRKLANTIWGREDVVGRRLPGNARWGSEGAEVVGVLDDVSFGHPAASVKPYVFTRNAGNTSAVVEANLTAAELQQALDRIDSSAFSIRVFNFRPLAALRDSLVAADRARGLLTIATAILVVVLAAFGFYGTQRYLVAAGRREYAIRASLGAGPRALGRLVISRALLTGAPGLVIGGILAFIAATWLRDEFLSPRVSAAVVTAWVVVGLTSILIAASLVPAREARRTQPAPLLRED
jgi:hypothetical protein